MPPASHPRRAAEARISTVPLGAAPSARGALSWETEEEGYLFEVDSVWYRVILGPADERSGLLRIEGRIGENPWQPLLREAGMLLRRPEGAVLPPSTVHQQCELEELRHHARGRILTLKYAERCGERVLRRTVELRLVGRGLEIRVEAPAPEGGAGFCGFSLGPIGPEGAREVPFPGLPDPLVVLEPEGFACGYPGRWQGRASAYPPGGAFYRPDTEGNWPAIRETFYLLLSPDPLEPLPSLPVQAAPHLAAVQGRITLDLFSEEPYAQDERLFRLLPQYGLRDILLIYRNWQQFGYQRRGPLLYPANPDRGTNEGFRAMLAAAREAGWLVALAEEYASLAPDSPYWAEKAVAQWWDGLPRQGRRPGQLAVAAHQVLEFARLEATQIQRNYAPSAVFVDAHTGWNPEAGLRQVDAAPNSPAGSESRAVGHTEGLLAFLRDTHEGPVVGSSGEGAARFDTFAAGMAEAVVRGPDGGQRAPLVVDYELREVAPVLLGLGAGSYSRFCGGAADEAVDTGRVDWDAYRVTEIALGHAGYVGNYRLRRGVHGPAFPGGSRANAVREYYLLRALQELYLGTKVRAISYRDGAELLDLTGALRRRLDLSQAQVRIEYANGLTVWVNRSAREAWPVQAEDAGYDLPPGGFLAAAPRQRFLAYSATLSGHRTDFCHAANYTFLDVRGGNPRSVEGMTTDGSVALLKSAVPGRHDVVLVNARQLILGEEEYRLSDRADVRLAHLSTREVEITVMDTVDDKPVHVAWPALNAAWHGSELTVLESRNREWSPSRCPVNQTRSGPQLARAHPGVMYRVRAGGPG